MGPTQVFLNMFFGISLHYFFCFHKHFISDKYISLESQICSYKLNQATCTILHTLQSYFVSNVVTEYAEEKPVKYKFRTLMMEEIR